MTQPKTIRSMIKSVLESAFDLLGVEAHLPSKNNQEDRTVFDRNSLSCYNNKDQRIALYYDGLKKSRVEWTKTSL